MAKKYLYPYLLFAIHRILSWTWSVRIVESDSFAKILREKKKYVLAHWHGDDPVVLFLARPYHAAIMTSTSADGEMMDRIVKLFGGATVRGSSTRGGVAGLKGLIRLSRGGRNPSLAVDGPKGPRHKVKPGVFELSKLVKGDICPIGVWVSEKWVFEKSWNKVYLPKPFSKIVIHLGDPMVGLQKKQDAKKPELADELAERIHRSSRLARENVSTN